MLCGEHSGKRGGLNQSMQHWPSELAQNVTLQALGSGIYWMVTVNVVVWMVAPLVAVTVRG
ncbi:MAG: hypothetical protein JWO80_5944 [Bryobacterales bacterium]|nr:hypothetical protein [Bryobacterales bacterium]